MENDPGKGTFTASATQHLVPVSFNRPVHALQATKISRYTIVGIVPAKHSIKIDRLLLDRQVPRPSHQVTKVVQASMEPSFLGSETHLEIALSVARAIEGKTQKIDGLWAFPPSFAGMILGKTTEFDKPCLGRRKGKTELTQPLVQGRLNTKRIGVVLKTQYKIINVAYHVGFTL
jgi:hypothetical protein